MKSYLKNKFEVIAHDYNSPLLRNEVWVYAFPMWPKLFALTPAVLAAVSQKNELEYIADLSTWTLVHDEMKEKVMADHGYLDNLIDETNRHCEKMNDWTEKNIFNIDLGKLEGKKLFELLFGFTELQRDAYAYGVTLPLLDFGGFAFVEGNLKKILDEKVNKKDFDKYFSIFTEPIHNSFAQDQEEDLLRLIAEFYEDENWRSDVVGLDSKKIKEKCPSFWQKLEQHALNHGWVYYVYTGPAFNEKNFLDFIRGYLEKGVDPETKLVEIENRKKKIKDLKEKYLKELQLDGFQLAIVNLAGKMVWAKPRRKDYQSKSYYHVEKLMREIAKRLYISLEQARSMPVEDVRMCLVDGGEVNLEKVNSIYDFHICVYDDQAKKVDILYGKEACEFSKKIKRAEEDIDTNVTVITGDKAREGEAEGIVRIINIPEEMSKMNDGDILVSTATTPNIVPVMKKAAAIVTDEGGLTCHAAIVSRELGIPCIVGTKIATKILKDGDKIWVDATNGVVKILKKTGLDYAKN